MSLLKRLEHLEHHTTPAGIYQRYATQYGADITTWNESTLGDCIAELTRIDPAGMAAAQARIDAMTDEELEAAVRADGWT